MNKKNKVILVIVILYTIVIAIAVKAGMYYYIKAKDQAIIAEEKATIEALEKAKAQVATEVEQRDKAEEEAQAAAAAAAQQAQSQSSSSSYKSTGGSSSGGSSSSSSSGSGSSGSSQTSDYPSLAQITAQIKSFAPDAYNIYISGSMVYFSYPNKHNNGYSTGSAPIEDFM